MSSSDDLARAVAAEAKLEKAREALRDIARQKLEVEVDDPEACDWLGGYEAIVRIARAALAAMESHDDS